MTAGPTGTADSGPSGHDDPGGSTDAPTADTGISGPRPTPDTTWPEGWPGEGPGAWPGDGPDDWSEDWRDDPVGADGADTGRSRARRWWWLVGVALVPWLVLAVTVLPDDGAPGASAPSSSAPSSPAPSPVSPPGGARSAPSDPDTDPATGAGHPTTAGDSRPPPTLRDPATGDPSSGAPRIREAVAVAGVVARAWLTDLGPSMRVPGIKPVGRGYVDQLHVAGVDHPAPGAVVVTLLAVLLEKTDGRYTSASLRRLAVPVVTGADGASPAGRPWWLPTPRLSQRTLPTEDLEDPGLLVDAGAALTAAGYSSVDVRSLRRTGSWPYVVTARAVAPGERRVARHLVWLRAEGARLVVAGTPARGRPGDTTAAVPAERAP